MSQDMTYYLDIAWKVASILSWLVAGLILLSKKIKSNRATSKLNSEEQNALKNKADQTAQEEELKDMAIFLCDRCAKRLPVSEGIHRKAANGQEYDVCPDCAKALDDYDVKLQTAQAELEDARKAYEVAQAKLQDLQYNPYAGAIVGEQGQAQSQNSAEDIRSKLGVK